MHVGSTACRAMMSKWCVCAPENAHRTTMSILAEHIGWCGACLASTLTACSVSGSCLGEMRSEATIITKAVALASQHARRRAGRARTSPLSLPASRV